MEKEKSGIVVFVTARCTAFSKCGMTLARLDVEQNPSTSALLLESLAESRASMVPVQRLFFSQTVVCLESSKAVHYKTSNELPFFSSLKGWFIVAQSFLELSLFDLLVHKTGFVQIP